MSFLATINPGFILIFAGLVGLFVPLRQIRHALMIIAPVVGILALALADMNLDLATARALGLDLVLYRVDTLNYLFGLAFLIAALLQAIYALHTDDRFQDGMAMTFAGTAISAVFAGDLMTLFIFWELTAISSVFLILKAQTKAAYNAAMRFLGLQILSGVMLLDGMVYVQKKTGTLDLKAFESVADPGANFILVAIAIKAAFPLLHNWMQDSYPKATVVGTVALSAFTSMLAVLVAARLFPGVDMLIWIGALMAVFPIIFAVLVNDLRKVLAYGVNSQVGLMICAVGLADLALPSGQLALNGAVGLAFVHVIFTVLLFMATGAVLHRAGTIRASELGGLYKSMPFTAVFCLVGAASMAAVPFFSGFAAQTLILDSALQSGGLTIWLMLLFASAGVVLHAGLKVPYCAFFSRDKGLRVAEAPFNMLFAMGLAALVTLAVGLPSFAGIGHGWLYDLLPYPGVARSHQPFEMTDILSQLQLLSLGVLAFLLLRRIGLYPLERAGTVLDFDWTYRWAGYGVAKWAGTVWTKAVPAVTRFFGAVGHAGFKRLENAFSPQGQLSRGGLNGDIAIWAAALLGAALLLSFISVN